MSYTPGSPIAEEFVTSGTTGAAADATGTPTATLARNGADDVAVTLAVARVDLGRYKVTGTIPATYTYGDKVAIAVAATVAGTAAKAVLSLGVLGAYRPGDALAEEFVTSDASGAAAAATGTPTATLTRNGVDDVAVTLTVAAVDTGRYRVTGTIPSGYAAGDVVAVALAATVAGVAAKAVLPLGPLGAAAVVGGDLRAAIYAALLADPDVAAIVGARIFPSESAGRRSHLPQSATLPCLTYRMASDVRPVQLGGGTGIATARMQVDAWSFDLAECVALQLVIRTKWQGWHGTIGDVEVTFARAANEEDLTEPVPVDGTDTTAHHISVDWKFRYREASPQF